MSWRERLREASFRGVRFTVLDDEREGGRRVQLHQYPGRDEPFAEDLGLKAGQFVLSCLLLGKEYDRARDALEAALDEAGPGTLIHPSRGSLRVVVMGYRTTESTRAGGSCRIAVTFAEAGEKREPRASVDTAAAVSTQADGALATAAADFADRFNVSGHPQWVADDAQSLLAALQESITAASNAFPGVPAELVKYRAEANGVSGSLGSLIREPASLAGRYMGLISGLAPLVDRPQNALRMYRRLFGAGGTAKPVIGTTPARLAQADNQDAGIALVQRAAVIEAARVSSTIGFDSAEAAIDTRDELAAEMDRLAEAAPDDVYRDLSALRVALVRDIASRAAQLPRVLSHTPTATRPALVVAFDLYGDPDRADEIVARNKIRHPGFVAGGETLEVLSD